eukprot:1052437-Prymnesium_polylepis.2
MPQDTSEGGGLGCGARRGRRGSDDWGRECAGTDCIRILNQTRRIHFALCAGPVPSAVFCRVGQIGAL